LFHGLDIIRQSGRRNRRSLTNTFSGIRPIDLPGFIVAEFSGAFVSILLMNWLLGRPEGGPHR